MMAVVPAVSVCPTVAVPVIVGAPVAGLFGAATSKTAESPYRGRLLARGVVLLLLRGPLPLVELLGWPRRTLDAPSEREAAPENDSVPSCPQPVMGWLPVWEVSGPSLPDSFLSLASSSQDPS